MKRTMRWAGVLALLGLSAWMLAGYRADRSYARREYEVEAVDAPSFRVEIPKGWRRPDYAASWESKTGFSTSSPIREPGSEYFVYGSLSIQDEGTGSIESVLAAWRKDEDDGKVSQAKLGELDALTWTSTLSFIDFAGEARTYVFLAPNGHIYSAHYQLTPRGALRMRQDYVFGRILASLKFKP